MQPMVYDQLGTMQQRTGNRSVNNAPRNTYRPRRQVGGDLHVGAVDRRARHGAGRPPRGHRRAVVRSRRRRGPSTPTSSTSCVGGWIAERDLRRGRRPRSRRPTPPSRRSTTSPTCSPTRSTWRSTPSPPSRTPSSARCGCRTCSTACPRPPARSSGPAARRARTTRRVLAELGLTADRIAEPHRARHHLTDAASSPHEARATVTTTADAFGIDVAALATRPDVRPRAADARTACRSRPTTRRSGCCCSAATATWSAPTAARPPTRSSSPAATSAPTSTRSATSPRTDCCTAASRPTRSSRTAGFTAHGHRHVPAVRRPRRAARRRRPSTASPMLRARLRASPRTTCEAAAELAGRRACARATPC